MPPCPSTFDCSMVIILLYLSCAVAVSAKVNFLSLGFVPANLYCDLIKKYFLINSFELIPLKQCSFSWILQIVWQLDIANINYLSECSIQFLSQLFAASSCHTWTWRYWEVIDKYIFTSGKPFKESRRHKYYIPNVICEVYARLDQNFYSNLKTLTYDCKYHKGVCS